MITTDDGRTVSGLLLDEGETMVQLRTSPTEQESVARESIESLTPSRVSFMPAGLHESLPPDAMRDLVGFLLIPKIAEAAPGNEPRVITIDSSHEIEFPAAGGRDTGRRHRL
ncbi:MAG: hypothetical protein R3B96_04915 [Pirellulaceae bacterium]